jgi:8-oxo-dGTP pyrophosphatase MutT (NUDIX family)
MSVKTLLFLYKPGEKQILLAMKKRGFGEGKWNGVGGKVEVGESIEEAVAREALEEIGVVVDPEVLKKKGVIHFSFEDKPEFTQDVHVYFATQWEEEPVESEEMKPEWYDIDEIPYSSMWIDDQYWLPMVLDGDTITAQFHFNNAGTEVLDMEINKD